MQHVIVATDLTPASDAAVERAAFASRAMGAGLHLLHVLPEHVLPLAGAARARQAEGALRYRAQALSRHPGPRVTCKVARGDTSRGIVRESEEMDTVLTVFGRRVAGARPRRLSGTTPERSLRLLRNAALVVCDHSPRETRYRKVLLAPDGCVGTDALLPHLRHLAPDATVHRIDPSGRGNGRTARRRAADHVRAMRRALDADLLVIGMPWDETLNPFRFRRLLTPLVRMPECDTLIVPQECDVVPPETADTAREPGRIRIAS
jgi:nucleotide-binding universal stress UspA family protein